MKDDDRSERIIAARGRLRDRFLAEMAATPSLSDPRPQGSGSPNRHGMPRLPVGQTETHKWPVLDLGEQPEIPVAKWSLRLDGACANPLTLDWEAFMALPQVDDVSDFHCVTTWSRLDMRWRGVRFADLAELAQVAPDARHVLCHAFDGYTTNLPLAEALKPDVLLVHAWDGAPLPREHGGPVRVVTPQLYAWKGAKWVSRLEFLRQDRPGFWETRGYSNTAWPWRNDRYA